MQLKRRALLGFAVAPLVIAATLALPLVAPGDASAAGIPRSPKGWSRDAVIRNAQRWVDQRVPYSQTSWYRGYRQDCSGFVSMAWNIHASYPTGMMSQIAKPIPKDALLPGDVLLNNSSTYAHVVLFERWAYTDKSAYIGYEQLSSTNRPVRRLIPYPYFRHGELFAPYRFVGVPPKPAPKPRPVPRAAPKPTLRPVAVRPKAPDAAQAARRFPLPSLALALTLAGAVGLGWGLSGRGWR